jgi:positive regulator of sigma E activity
MHPSMIHFAMLLLMTSPLFIVVGAILTPLRGRATLAIVLMLFLGTAGVLLAMGRSRQILRPGCLPAVQTTSPKV